MDRNAMKAPVIYIVDDDEHVLKALARLVRAQGYYPKAYQMPARFLTEVQHEVPACILLDITMPRMTGLQVQAVLQERGITMPVIAVSAQDDEESRQHGRELGVHSFLQKPTDDHALLDAIVWALRPH
jgi:FixJ family two-component response regulator